MSVFKTQARTFKSDITGEEREYKINNMVWVILKERYGLTQQQYAEIGAEEESIAATKFIASVLVANGLDVTYEEVAENTDAVSIVKFNMAWNNAVNPDMGKLLDEMREKVKAEAEKNQKK